MRKLSRYAFEQRSASIRSHGRHGFDSCGPFRSDRRREDFGATLRLLAQGRERQTALIAFASLTDANVEVFRILYPGSAPKSVDAEGWSAFMHASHRGHLEMILSLLPASDPVRVSHNQNVDMGANGAAFDFAYHAAQTRNGIFAGNRSKELWARAVLLPRPQQMAPPARVLQLPETDQSTRPPEYAGVIM